MSNPNTAYIWETQPHQPGMPFCELLKIKGARYPYGSIVQVGAPMSPRYACEAFVCDANGRKRSIWIGEETSLKAAEQAVISIHMGRADNSYKVGRAA